MTTLFHPRLINGPFGDPGLFVDFQFGRRALLMDLGDLANLSPRELLRVTHVFVTHTHMDHFVGFDALLRLWLGRDGTLHMFGPAGFVDRVRHKLAGYTWNLVGGDSDQFRLVVREVAGDGAETAWFSTATAFRPEPLEPDPELDVVMTADGLLTVLREDNLAVRAAVLDHKIPCIGYAVEETRKVNIWKNRLAEMGLVPGPWIEGLKAAILAGAPDETMIDIVHAPGATQTGAALPLGTLKERLARVVPGRKIAYVVDVGYTDRNIERIVRLAGDADILFIETAFLQRDVDLAARRAHLTAAQAGEIARRARVGRLVPLHFSTRYEGEPGALEEEANRARRDRGDD